MRIPKKLTLALVLVLSIFYSSLNAGDFQHLFWGMSPYSVARIQGIGGGVSDNSLILFKDENILGLPADLNFFFENKKLNRVSYNFIGPIKKSDYELLKYVLTEKYGDTYKAAEINQEAMSKWKNKYTMIELLLSYKNRQYELAINYMKLAGGDVLRPIISERELKAALEKL